MYLTVQHKYNMHTKTTILWYKCVIWSSSAFWHTGTQQKTLPHGENTQKMPITLNPHLEIRLKTTSAALQQP